MQQQFHRNVQNQFSSNEVLELLATVTNVPKDAFVNVLAGTILEQSIQSSEAALTQEEMSASTIEKNQLLLERLNYRNGIHYSVPSKNI